MIVFLCKLKLPNVNCDNLDVDKYIFDLKGIFVR
jgi:hypothetical protein